MTNIEKVNKALENADESKIKEVLDFLGYEEDGKFVPKNGDTYWAITMVGMVDYYSWFDGRFDNCQLSSGNCYQTKEEAEQALDFQTRKANLIKEIEDSSDIIDWGDGQQYKYYFSYKYASGSLRYTFRRMVQYDGVTYTTNKVFLEELIETRSDEIKELLFGIK